MKKERLIHVFLVFMVLISASGCCLTGKKPTAPKAPLPTHSSQELSPCPPKTQETVPVLSVKGGDQVPAGGITTITSTCPTGGCPVTPSQTASSGIPSSESSFSSYGPGTTGSIPSGSTTATLTVNGSLSGQPATISAPAPGTTQVGKPIATETKSAEPGTLVPPRAVPDKSESALPSPNEVGGFDYTQSKPSVSPEAPVSSAAPPFHNASSEAAEKPEKPERPKGRTVSMEKEPASPSTPAAKAPAKPKEGTPPAEKSGTLAEGVDSQKESKSQNQKEGEGNVTGVPARQYTGETSGPKYAQNYSGPNRATTEGNRLFVSPTGTGRVSGAYIQIKAVP